MTLERLVRTMAEMTKDLIELLNGQNYATWNVQFKIALIKDGHWNIVTGTEGEPEGEMIDEKMRISHIKMDFLSSQKPLAAS